MFGGKPWLLSVRLTGRVSSEQAEVSGTQLMFLQAGWFPPQRLIAGLGFPAVSLSAAITSHGFSSAQALPPLTAGGGYISDSEQPLSWAFRVFLDFRILSVVHHSTAVVCKAAGGEPCKFLHMRCHFMLPPVAFLLSA